MFSSFGYSVISVVYILLGFFTLYVINEMLDETYQIRLNPVKPIKFLLVLIAPLTIPLIIIAIILSLFIYLLERV